MRRPSKFVTAITGTIAAGLVTVTGATMIDDTAPLTPLATKSSAPASDNPEYRCPTGGQARTHALAIRRPPGCSSVYDEMADELKIERRHLRQAIAHARHHSSADTKPRSEPLPSERIVIAAAALGLPPEQVKEAYDNARNRMRARRRAALEKHLDEAVRSGKIEESDKFALLRRYDSGTLGRTWGAIKKAVERALSR
ncbi:hypothetical protein SAMN05421595_2636 [Austwickia chelonae]|uniref:Uncharacterized protein n=1 Tax=Austwickia chelonae NBRC 105200 TaxID=1184607 RepID=K6UNX2_9MICO|nr:hypothetical protein [Austwickia chelonae]GAB79326.1 hypothetical protein AUCHE_22_00960 [Austwickia chelonae NBRC 105200]SEW38331.1 hypothetical protein SAMN05421595_2636 [Austwickia chelonae]